MRGSIGLAAVMAAASLSAAAACSTFRSDDATPDGGAIDATTEPNPDGARPALIEDGFEAVSGTACGSWAGVQAQLELVPDAGHDGSFACRVCSSFTGDGYFQIRAIDAVVAKTTAGSEYSIVAFVRLENGPANTQLAAAFEVSGDFRAGTSTSATSWTVVSQTIKPAASSSLRAEISGRKVDADAGTACFLVDDIIVRITP